MQANNDVLEAALSVDPFTSVLATVIRSVPGSDESPLPITELCRRAGCSADTAAVIGPLVASLIGAFGVLRADGPDRDPEYVNADSETAALFLQAYADCLENGTALLENWSRPGIVDPPFSEHEMTSGPQFLHLLERRRLRADPQGAPRRRTQVAQVLIGRRSRWGGAAFLMHWDAAARRYQLPGGHRRLGDTDLRDVAVRELQEEIPGFAFDPTLDRLAALGTVEITQLSRTYGVLTEYSIAYFHLRSARTDLPVGPQARWVPGRDLFAPDGSVDGRRFDVAGLRKLQETLPGGIEGLAAGPNGRASGRLVAISRANPFEFWGFVVGLLGLASSILIFVLSP